ncbi:MAG: hypothetical protein M1816_002637 [Peltula sp. TS41687]|nr:MAG: hypothetical protein M1816_002637 [Peltula sp. TS41687]
MANNALERFLDIPPMEVQTLALKYEDSADRVSFKEISDSILAHEDGGDDVYDARDAYLYEAGFCPGMFDRIE